jgi:hypothetical protein
VIEEPSVGPDSNWVVTGFDNALEAKRRVDALLDSRRVPGLERLGVTFGHGSSVYVIFDSLLRWTGRHASSGAVEQITRLLVAAFPDRAVYYTHDTIGFELVCGDVTLASAIADGQAEQVSGSPTDRHPKKQADQ